MMKLIVAIALLLSAAARADVDAYFATAVLDVPWASTLQQAIAAHPGGTARPNRHHNADEGHIYEVSGDFRPLGLNQSARHIHFLFSNDNKLSWVSFHFSYADRDEVLYGIAQVLGQNYEVRDEKISRVFSWKSGRYAYVALVISSDPNLPWAYLSVCRR